MSARARRLSKPPEALQALPRRPGTLPFVLELTAFFLLLHQARRVTDGLAGLPPSLATALLALPLALLLRFLMRWRASDPASAWPVRPPGAALVALGVCLPRRLLRQTALAAWVALVLVVCESAFLIAVALLEPPGLGGALDRIAAGVLGGPLARGLVVRHLLGLGVLAAVWAEELMAHGYVQGLGVRLFGPAGACAPWLLLGMSHAVSGYLFDLGAVASLFWAVTALLPGPLLEAYRLTTGSIVPLVPARMAVDAVVLPWALGLGDAERGAALLAGAAILGAALVALVPLTLALSCEVRSLVRGMGTILGDGLPLGIPLAAGLLAGQIGAHLVPGDVLPWVAAAACLLVARLI